MSTSIMWFRRDLRLHDNSALLEAFENADDVVPLFILDPTLIDTCGPVRLAFLMDSLRELNESMGGNLVIRRGHPSRVLRDVVKETESSDVFCTGDFAPYGVARDKSASNALERIDVALHSVDSPYAVEPGSVHKADGSPYQVFTPYSREWRKVGWGLPQAKQRSPRWRSLSSDELPDLPELDVSLPTAGERAAMARLKKFDVSGYESSRDFPAVAGTSRLSPYLKWGVLHPRQVLDVIKDTKFVTELCWREFYADVLFHRPDTVDHAYRKEMSAMKVDGGKRSDAAFEAWCNGMTGYPIVDAGMRQLLGEGWMHNRVRMIVASFLIKDLHIDWTRGAHHFMTHLVDGDIASNTHGWQWVAGTGTDAAPYFRIFNPVTQAKKFDPDGAYIKKWVPELRDLDKRHVHAPWQAPDGPPNGYPEPMVDHDAERKEALARYSALRS